MAVAIEEDLLVANNARGFDFVPFGLFDHDAVIAIRWIDFLS